MVAYADYATDARIKNYVGALVRAGYEVDVFALGTGGHPARTGVRVHCLHPRMYRQGTMPFLVSQLWFLLRVTLAVSLCAPGRRYRLVHVHNMPDFLVFATPIARLFGAGVILDVHDTMPEAYATKQELPLHHPVVRLLVWEERLSAALADMVITTNELHKQALVGHGIRSEKIQIIMNVADPEVFRPLGARPSGESLTLGYHGTVAKRLGIDTILRAVNLAKATCPGLRLKLIGDGEFMPEVKRLVAELELSQVVQMRGWVPVEQLPTELAEVDLGVIGNTLETEQRQNWMLPVKMLECAALGVPSIAPRLRVIAHYFDDSNALFYTPDSASDLARCIVEVYGRRERLQELKAGLQRFNERYHWAAMEQEYLRMVRQLAA
jgi:glycosyltransferase involved in cell wall biosynthesis